jgi:hypothetical protein
MVLLGGLATTLLMIVLIGLLARAQYRRENNLVGASGPKDCARLVSQARVLESAAAEALEAAQRAATTHEQLARDLAVAEAEREAAWHAHTAATQVHQEAQQAGPASTEPQSMTGDDQKEISAAARAAYRRGEISVDELKAVWKRVDGWDDSADDRSHLLSRLRAEEAEAWRRYHAAAFAERTGKRAIELAEAASRALTEDAAEAARQAEISRIAANDCISRYKRR